MSNSTEQFFDFFKSYASPEKMMNSFKNLPVMDFSSFNKMMKKNVEVITATNQIIAETVQNIVKKNTDMFQNSASEMLNTFNGNASTKDTDHARSHSEECARSLLTKSMDHAKEIIDITAKSSSRIFDVISNASSENSNEMFNKARQTV